MSSCVGACSDSVACFCSLAAAAAAAARCGLGGVTVSRRCPDETDKNEQNCKIETEKIERKESETKMKT